MGLGAISENKYPRTTPFTLFSDESEILPGLGRRGAGQQQLSFSNHFPPPMLHHGCRGWQYYQRLKSAKSKVTS